ncbi:MAG: DUF2059 domain-containing protein, partial [Candidatus Omnitrophica bacterium]|nr:DUF2059 domain-containing protein [Candidatus Omnitrophota bacterium]
MKSKKFIFLAAFMLVASFCSMSSAETIYLKDGRVLREKIVERKSYYIITKVGRVFNKYYLGQIDRIEEETLVDDMDVDRLEAEGVSIDKAKLIVVFINVSGVRRVMEENLKQVLNGVPEEQRGLYAKLFNVDEIIERLVPLYDKYYTEKELWDIVEFYESPAGKKILEVTPEIMKESIGLSLKYF